MHTPYSKKPGDHLFSINTFVLSLLTIGMLFASSYSFSATTKDTLAESTISGKSNIKNLPEAVKHQICRDLSTDKTSCEINHTVRYIRSVKQTNDQVVMFFYLQDDKPGYHRGVSIPVKLNSNGQWITGSAFVGEPRNVIRDVRGGLWMHAQFSSSGNTPRLLYSKQGLDWLEIALPETDLNKQVTHFENISKLCFQGGTLIMSLQSRRSNNKPIMQSWRSNLSTLTATLSKQKTAKPEPNQKQNPKQHWEKLSNKQATSHTCNDYKAKNNDWLIHDGETLTLLQHDKKNLTFKVMHESKAKKVANQPTKPYAIQVGAYSNHTYVDQLVTAIQKQGFKTFTKLLHNPKRLEFKISNHKSNEVNKLKKLYIGPFQSREITLAKLTELKNKMRDNKAIQSAFVLKLNP